MQGTGDDPTLVFVVRGSQRVLETEGDDAVVTAFLGGLAGHGAIGDK